MTTVRPEVVEQFSAVLTCYPFYGPSYRADECEYVIHNSRRKSSFVLSPPSILPLFFPLTLPSPIFQLFESLLRYKQPILGR